MSTITKTAVASGSAEGSVGRDGEQSRARYPDSEGFVERDGQRLFYEVYGEGEETVWQAKYFLSQEGLQWSQVDDSIKTARTLT